MVRQRKEGSLKDNQKSGFNKDNIIKLFLLICTVAVLSLSMVCNRGLPPRAIAGTSFIIALLLVILYRDLMRYKPSIYKDYRLILLIGTLLSGNLILSRGFYYILEGFSEWLGNIPSQLLIYAIPLAVGPMLTALLIDIHTAIVVSVITSLLGGLWLGNPSYSIFTFVAGVTGAFGVIRCKRRSAIWRAGLFVGLVGAFTSLTITLLGVRFLSLETPLSAGVAFLNGIIVATLVSASLPLLEHFFRRTTDISLLELLDLDQPLLRNLLVVAPGTYHHSIIVGNLVESAAEAVGVNPLLARVSAYYHDIGKIKMPEYFIENQTAPISKHDTLTPHMSSLILISHVKEGVELAMEHKLPESIIDIIQQHHGTSLITYFYQKAKAEHGDTASSLTDEDFRYPGPKPRTRVSALILMADAVEAASRVLTDPTPSRVSALVNRIVDHFLIDGQLNDCELTLKDLQEVKKHFIYILNSIFHRRISYPGFEIKDEDSDKEPAKAETSKQDKDKKGSPKDPFPLRTIYG